MVTPLDPDLRSVQQTVAAVLEAILKRRRMTGADLARATEAQGGASKKTVYNALDGDKPPNLRTLLDYARALEIPVWALLLEGIQDHPELLDHGGLRPLVRVIENYIHSGADQRKRIERMAQAMRDDSDLDKR